MTTRSMVLGLLGALMGCARPAATTPAGPDRPRDATAVRVISTSDWGCVGPPFRHERCGREPEEGEEPSCFLLPRTSAGPWNPALYGGAVHVLQGRHTGETMTVPQWYRAQGKPVPEGVCQEASFPVFAFDDWCIDASPSDFEARYGGDVGDEDYQAWFRATAARIEARRCP